MNTGPSFVTANGVKFAYLEQGSGPLVLLVHGFPDTAHTWDAGNEHFQPTTFQISNISAGTPGRAKT